MNRGQVYNKEWKNIFKNTNLFNNLQIFTDEDAKNEQNHFFKF
jgi:hypothetical protein